MSSIWFREDVSPEEWETYALEQEKLARDREVQKQENYAEDVWDFYANDIISRYFKLANLARNHGISWVWGLVELDNPDKVVDADIVNGKFGRVWRIQKDDGSVEWVNVSQAQKPEREQAFYASKGYKLVRVYYHFTDGKYGLFPIKNRGVVEIEDYGFAEVKQNNEYAWDNLG